MTGTETVTGPPATPVTFRNWSVCTASTPGSTGQILAMDLTPLAYRATVSDGASSIEDAGGGKLGWSQGNVFEMSATSTGDTTAPSIIPTTPTEGQSFAVDETVSYAVACDDGASSPLVVECDGNDNGSDVFPGQGIDTSTPGTKSVTWTARDSSGNVSQLTVHYVVASTDSDGDGVVDAIDVGIGAFDDGSGTSGAIVNTGGNTVKVEDQPAPDGVHVTVAGTGSTPATISACGFSTIQISPGSDLVLTCGSVKLEIAQGSVAIVLAGGITTVAVPAGDIAEVTDLGGGTFSVAHQAGAAPVTVTTFGASSTIPAGGTSSVAVLTVGNLCTLTKLYIQGSAKYKALPAKQKQVVDALVGATCMILQTITPRLTPKQKQLEIALYQAAVRALVAPGWLTQEEATTLRTLAAGL